MEHVIHMILVGYCLLVSFEKGRFDEKSRLADGGKSVSRARKPTLLKCELCKKPVKNPSNLCSMCESNVFW